MTRTLTHRSLVPGTTGWSARDLDDPKIEAQWEAGHFQILEGILAHMPPAYWDTSSALDRLVDQVKAYLREQNQPADFGFEVDVILGDIRVPKADVVWLSAADRKRQLKAVRPKVKGLKYGRLRIAPTLIIENVSKGHEADDRVLKRGYYADAGVPNYWILDVYTRTLECLRLKRGVYAIDQIGRGRAKVTPACFAGLVIDLARVWDLP